MTLNESLKTAAEELVRRAAHAKLTIITAESCTSGLLATVLSEAPGAATILHGGFVTYTKEHKRVAAMQSSTSLMDCGRGQISLWSRSSSSLRQFTVTGRANGLRL